ncbi:hypothetical protein M413DRAFT_413790 [Hebeloma cylindrosporum]|uniref:CxC5 like cysteine cluster associated with KDZ domain-containing protein n=1 Tax=Hebeloma cylindrosporum TaxID=76867 RepID=A0A0C3BU96_HEBCY|nr:hypothetical protein M413DRAFT_413790 [Hebeloma cylindrosporum h7]
MSLEDFMALSAVHSSHFTPEILLKISAFITYAPRFKDDIILVQAADWPLDVAPPYLPQSISLLLANLCETSEEAIEMLWTFTKQIIWEYSCRAKEIDERFRLHGKDLGYQVLYPPSHLCMNSDCERAKKGLKLQKMEQTKAIFYTIDQGACPAWAVKLFCQDCKTSYHLNYRVHENKRYYYERDSPG